MRFWAMRPARDLAAAQGMPARRRDREIRWTPTDGGWAAARNEVLRPSRSSIALIRCIAGGLQRAKGTRGTRGTQVPLNRAIDRFDGVPPAVIDVAT